MSEQSTYLATSYQLLSTRNIADDFDEVLSSEDFYEQMITESNSEPRSLSLEEIIDLMGTPPATVKSTRSQTEEENDKTIDDQSRMLVSFMDYFYQYNLEIFVFSTSMQFSAVVSFL